MSFPPAVTFSLSFDCGPVRRPASFALTGLPVLLHQFLGLSAFVRDREEWFDREYPGINLTVPRLYP